MRWLVYTVLLAAVGFAVRGDPVSPPDDGHGWSLISTPIIEQLSREGRKLDWPGQTTGVAVDRKTGDVWVIPVGQGVWRSSDHGRTYQRIDGGAISGRCETACAINADPAGGRFAFFMLDGKGGMTLDGGKTWTQFKDVGRNWDYAAVDWSDPQARTIFAARHESGGELYLSTDSGRSWKQIDKDPKYETPGGLGVLPGGALLMTKGSGILRSADAGATWTKVSDLQPTGRVMVFKDGVAWWVARTGIIVSKDQGKTWEQWGAPVEGAGWGPWFGNEPGAVMVATKKSWLLTTDAGRTWKTVAAKPAIKDFEPARLGWFLSYAWDPQAGLLYASRMGFGTYRFELKEKPDTLGK